MKKLIIALCCTILIGLFTFLPRILIIKKITCQNQFGQCSSILISQIPQDKKSLYESRQNIKNILEKNIGVIKYSIRLKLPDTLSVYVIERKPTVAFSQNNDQKNFIIIDSEGIVITKSAKTTLPVILTDSAIDTKIGEKVNNELKFVSSLQNDLYTIYGNKLSYLEKGVFKAQINGGINVIFPNYGDRDLLIGSLRIILSRLNRNEEAFRIRNESSVVKTIDLRFKNPVIKLS
jgi:hypothetical protein